MTLGEVIKTYRENAGESMEVFANKCGLSKGYISMLENGVNPRSKKPIAPTLPTLYRIAGAMGVSLDYLLEMIDGKTEITVGTGKEDHFDSKDFSKEESIEISDMLLNALNFDGIMFDGHEASAEEIEIIRDAITFGLEQARKRNKEKYTPKKYRKD